MTLKPAFDSAEISSDPVGREPGSCRDCIALNSHELQRLSRNAFNLETQFDRFSNPLRDLVKRASLRVATGELRYGRDVITVLIPLYHYVKLALRFDRHALFYAYAEGRTSEAFLPHTGSKQDGHFNPRQASSRHPQIRRNQSGHVQPLPSPFGMPKIVLNLLTHPALGAGVQCDRTDGPPSP
jgi:hypothetical protein